MDRSEAVGRIAVNKAFGDDDLDAAKGLIDVGSLAQLELTLKLTGTLKRGRPTTAKPTCNLLNKAILAELIRRLGVTREAFKAALLEIATEAIVGDQFTVAKAMTNASPELLTVLKEIEDEVIANLPPQPRAGAIRVQVVPKFSRLKVEFGATEAA